MLFFNRVKNIKPNTEFIAQNIKYYKTIESTNNTAFDNDCKDGTLFIAEKQTKGKGRMGRKWFSKKGCGIWMSIALMPEIEPERINLITLVAGLAVCKTLKKIYNMPFKIKWPNDIVINGKKVCGILTEGRGENGKITKVVTGIGINVNQKSFPDEINNIATSLYMLTAKKSDRAKIINVFAEIFETYYKLLLKGNTDELMGEYWDLCITIGKDIIATKDNNEIKGKATGISQTGELIIKKEDGTSLNINSGEVSVRGIYGYI